MRCWLSLVALAAACSSQPEPKRPPQSEPPPATPDASVASSDASLPLPSPIELPSAPDPALAKRLDAAIDRALAEQMLVGVVVMVARDGKLVYARGAGFADREAKLPATTDTLFRWASMTKPLTAALALALV